MADYILKAETGHIGLSPVLFRLSARDYFKGRNYRIPSPL